MVMGKSVVMEIRRWIIPLLHRWGLHIKKISGADLRDFEGYHHPKAKACPIRTTKQEVLVAIRRPKAERTPGPDGIPNRILQACADKLPDMLTPLFQACAEQGYRPRVFRVANTIVMKNPPWQG